MRVAFIGAGTMAEAMVRGIRQKKLVEPGDIIASDVRAERRDFFKGQYGARPAADNVAAAREADVAVLAVKPQALDPVLQGLKGCLRPHQAVLSIVAGASMARIEEGLGFGGIVRAMPNTPAQIGAGVTVWTAAPSVSAEQKERVRSLLGVLGREFFVSSEDYVDMATAVSGSGPAYVFAVIEAFTDAAVHIGLPRELAAELVLGTISGSTQLAQGSGKHPAELRNQVTSPGGTTAEGLLKLEEGGLRAAFASAVIAAYQKAKALEARR